MTKWVKWTKLGQKRAKFGPNWIGVPILIEETCTFVLFLVFLIFPATQMCVSQVQHLHDHATCLCLWHLNRGNLLIPQVQVYFPHLQFGSLLSKLAVVGWFGPNLAQIWPNLVHLKTSKDWHYVSGAMRVLMTLKNILRLWQWWLLSETYYDPKSRGLYFQNWLFWPNLAQIWSIWPTLLVV